MAYLQAIKEGAEESEFKFLYQIFDRVKINRPRWQRYGRTSMARADRRRRTIIDR